MDAEGIFFGGSRLSGIFGNSNIEASICAAGIFCALAVLCGAERNWERALFAAALACSAFAFLLAFSMVALACFAAAVVFYLIAAGTGRSAALVRMSIRRCRGCVRRCGGQSARRRPRRHAAGAAARVHGSGRGAGAVCRGALFRAAGKASETDLRPVGRCSGLCGGVCCCRRAGDGRVHLRQSHHAHGRACPRRAHGARPTRMRTCA